MDSEIRCLTVSTRRSTIARGGKLAAVLGLLATGVWGQAAEAKKKHKKKKKKKPVSLHATLSGANEFPPDSGDPNATGSCSFTVKGSQICGTFNLSTSPPSPVSGTHIHKGLPGADGPIVVNFGVATLGQEVCFTCPSSACSDSSILSQITSDAPGFYCNIHTNAFTDGAARGQLVKG
jgi:CHRD domain